MNDLFCLTDEQIERLRPFFPKSHGKPRVNDRRGLSGIVFVNRNGLRWRDALSAYGPHKTLYNRWKRWGRRGVFAQLAEVLENDAAGEPGVDLAVDRDGRPKDGCRSGGFDAIRAKEVLEQVGRYRATLLIDLSRAA